MIRVAQCMLIICLGLCPGIVAFANSFYVAQQATNASDQNDGTEEHPWKTLSHATTTAKSGDSISVKRGIYREALIPEADNVQYRVFGDDAVVLAPLESKPLGLAAWTCLPKTNHHVFECVPPTRGEGKYWDESCILRVDGLAFEFVKVTSDPKAKIPRPPYLTQSEVRRWTLLENGNLQINLGGDRPDQHQIELVEKSTGIIMRTKACSVRGFEIQEAGTGIVLSNEGNTAEDCVVRHANRGVDITGRSNVVRRCAFLRCWQGLSAGDCPGQHIIEENFFLGIGHPDLKMASPQYDLNNPWGPRCGIRFGNINFCVMRHNVLSDVVWAGWWPDVNCYGNYFYGNLIRNGCDRGVYNEYPSNDSRIFYNAISGCEAGITFRFCWHTMTMYNYLSNNSSTGLAFWGPHTDATYLFDNLISRNLVEGSRYCLSIKDDRGVKAGLPTAWESEGEMSPSSRFRMESNQFENNIYRGKPTECFADFNGVKFATLEAFTKATGMERGSCMDDNASLRDLSLECFTVRIPESCNPGEAVPLVGNPIWGGVHADPLPYAGEDNVYFWSQGNADSLDRNPAFSYSYEWPHFEKPVRRLIRSNPEADPTKPLAPDAEPIVWLECIGTLVDRIPKAGSGFWSPSMPTVGGAEIQVSWQMNGSDLKSVGTEGGPVALVRFQTLTGQQIHQELILGQKEGDPSAKTNSPEGTFAWRRIHACVHAPENAERFSVFLGLRPASGTVRYADIRIDTAPDKTTPKETKPVRSYRPISLYLYSNHSLDTDVGGPKGAEEVDSFVRNYCRLPLLDLTKIKNGTLQSDDIPFKIEKAISLGCFRRPPVTLPLDVNGITIRQKVSRLYFLHAGPIQMGTQEYWRYIVHYEDGQMAEVVPVEKPGHLRFRQAYFTKNESVQPAYVTKQIKGIGSCVQWDNPRPESTVKSIDFRSMDAGQAVLLAITAGLPE